MPLQEFNEDHMEVVIQKLSKEQNKQIFLMGDFNVGLLKASQHKHSSIFLNILESNSLIPQILLPTRINNRSSTLIDNIFTNSIDAAIISGNLTSTVSDHLPQFLIMPLKNNSIPKQHNIFIRDIKKINEDKLITEIRNLN